MLILDEYSETIVIDNINGPIIPEYMHILDLDIMDYTLAPIVFMEEVVCKSISLTINGFTFILPASMTILIADEETTQLDVAKVYDVAGKNFKAVVYGNNSAGIKLEQIYFNDYHEEWCNVSPALNRNQMLCHPINKDEWINVGSSDVYNKYLKNKLTGDLI